MHAVKQPAPEPKSTNACLVLTLPCLTNDFTACCVLINKWQMSGNAAALDGLAVFSK